MRSVDLSQTSLRELNATLHRLRADTNETHWHILNPRGQHAIVAGLNVPITVEIEGHAGYYCGGMNKEATIILNGNAGQGVAENMMSGVVHVKGDASQAAGATGCGGLLVVDGNAAARCGISMKGIDIVVKGSVGHLSAFMGQAGNLVVLGNAGEALGGKRLDWFRKCRPQHDHHPLQLPLNAERPVLRMVDEALGGTGA